MKKPQPHHPPTLWDAEEDPETPEDHLANADAARVILETMILAGAETLGELIERFPGMGMDAIRQELQGKEVGT